MSFIDSNLMQGEVILYRAKLHWIIFVWPIFWLVLSAALFIAKVPVLGVVFLFVAAVTGLSRFIDYATSEFGVTDKRVLIKVGFIRRKSLEILLGKVEGIQVDQDIVGRIFGYGSIVVSGTGGTKEPFHKISAPLEFRKKVQERLVR